MTKKLSPYPVRLEPKHRRILRAYKRQQRALGITNTHESDGVREGILLLGQKMAGPKD